MGTQPTLPTVAHDPLPAEAQLELARIHDGTKIVRSRSKVQAVAISVVGLITAALVIGSIILTLNDKESPAFFGTTVSLLVTGLVSSVAYEAGRTSQPNGERKQQ